MIGIFDSGLGGLALYHAIKARMPHVPIIYYADFANHPYGNKQPEEVARLTQQGVDRLVDAGAKLVVIACHTASVHTNVKPLYIPIVKISPFAVDALLDRTDLERIALIGTKSTIDSFYFQERIVKRELFPIAAPLFVSIVEEGFSEHPLADAVSYTYLDHLKHKNLDAALLVCTHFSFLKDSITRTLRVEIIDPTTRCAQKVEQLVSELETVTGEDTFLNSGAPSILLEQFKRGKLNGSEKENLAHRG